MGFKACMEIRFGPHAELAKSQGDLLTAVRKSEIHTFGWPIAIVLNNDPEGQPKSYSDGIRAEVEVQPEEILGRASYDCWALEKRGDFYLLQSLFEDTRAKDTIFFETRIVRVTEALMFASQLYRHLGAPEDSLLSVRITHRGLKGRHLTSSGNRYVRPKISLEAVAQSEIVVNLGAMPSRLLKICTADLAEVSMRS